MKFTSVYTNVLRKILSLTVLYTTFYLLKSLVVVVKLLLLKSPKLG